MAIDDIKNEIERRLDDANKQMRQQHDCHDESFINGKINALEGVRKFLIKNQRTIKVRDLIKQLELLDRDRNIFIQYDGCYLNEPDINVATEDDVEMLHEDYPQLKVGDYLMS